MTKIISWWFTSNFSSILIYFSKRKRITIEVIFWWFISDFSYFAFRLLWHISQRKRITIGIIEFISSIYFDLFIKRNALRPKSLFSQLFWKFFLRQKSYFDDLLQISLISFRSILAKKHITIEVIDDLFFQSILVYFSKETHYEERQIEMLWQMTLRSKNLTKRSKNLERNSVSFANAMIVMIVN